MVLDGALNSGLLVGLSRRRMQLESYPNLAGGAIPKPPGETRKSLKIVCGGAFDCYSENLASLSGGLRMAAPRLLFI